jgi:hypothetical protein
MAVSALSSARARAHLVAPSLPPVVLVLTLVAPALDLLAIVQPAASVPHLGMLATAVASLTLLVIWARYPRTSWLAAAGLASVASLVMRIVGADVAPLLSLLAVVALGIGGAFASPVREAEAWLV